MSKYLIILILGLAACTSETAEPEDCEPVTAETAEPVSCEVVGQGEEDLVLKFSDPNIAAPGGLDCVSLGGGVFDCKPDFCITVFYPGNCPQCPYTNQEGSTGE